MERHDAEVRFEYGGREFLFGHANPNDHIFNIVNKGSTFYELTLLEALRPHLKPGDLVIDAGANVGNHSLFFAGVCGCRVMAFEPVPQAFDVLQRNIARNGLGDLITPFRMALGAEAGVAQVDLGGASDNLGSATLTPGVGDLEVARLDSLVPSETPTLIKIDTEGWDLAVLRGAGGVLSRAHPLVCIEAKTGAEFAEVFDVMSAQGYLPIGVYNYSPTHLFLHAPEEAGSAFAIALSRFVSESCIRTEAEADRLRRRIVDLERRMAELSQRDKANPGRFSLKALLSRRP